MRSSRDLAALLPNLLTLVNLLCGASAFYVLAAHGSPMLALGLLAVALVADLLDGRVARALGVEGPLGAVLDSLADLVSFGLVPAAAIAIASSESPTWLSYAAGAAVVSAAGYRLARFTAEALAPLSERSAPPLAKPAFKGLPVTIPAAILVGAVVSGVSPHPAVLAAFAIVLSGLMVSRIPFRSFKERPLGLILTPVLVLAVALSLMAGSTRFGVGAALALGGLLFVVLGLSKAASTHLVRRRRLSEDAV